MNAPLSLSRTSPIPTMKCDPDLLERIDAVLPEIESNAAQAERDRMLPKRNVELLKSTGLHRVFLPMRYGGTEQSLPEFAECVVRIASVCPSSAWAFGLMCTHNYMLAHFCRRMQDDIWADDPDATASSSIAPFGRAEEVEGGIRLSGRFGWSSGCDHTEWAILGLHHPSYDDPKRHAFAIVPRADYEVLDDWFVAAMRGSGSKSIVVDGAFVPWHRVQLMDDMLREGTSAGSALYPDSRLFQSPYRPYFASVFAAVGLGIAERMLDAFRELNLSRKRAYTGASVATTAPILLRLGESTHQVAAARALMEQTWEDHRRHAEVRRYPNQRTAVQWRTHQAYAIKMCTEAVDRLFSACGGSAWFEGNPLQRMFRDMHIVGAHAYADYDLCAQAMGREQLGLPPDPAIAPAP